MAAPISMFSKIVLLVCMAILPYAAFFGAYAFDEDKRRKWNMFSFGAGLLIIAIVGVVLYLNT